MELATLPGERAFLRKQLEALGGVERAVCGEM
jgi:hypothetical protein